MPSIVYLDHKEMNRKDCCKVRMVYLVVRLGNLASRSSSLVLLSTDSQSYLRKDYYDSDHLLELK